MDRIFARLRQERPSAAIRFHERLMEARDLLTHMPLLGRVAHSTRMLRKGYRRFVVDEYLVYYKVRGDFVEVYEVVHAARKEGSGD